MRVFITGASGFIGRTLGTQLRERGDEVCGVDIVADTARDIVAGDISEPGAWQVHVRDADLVIHTAALVSNAGSLDESWRVNVLGTRRVLEAAAGAGAGRVVCFSSVRAFSDVGFPDGVTEDHPVRTDGNAYVDTKIAGEQVALQAHAAGEVPVTVVRPGDVYGPGSRPWTLLPLELIKKNAFMLPAMGNGVFSPVFVDDLVHGVLLAADSDAAAGQVYTISGGVGVACKDFFGHYYRMLGKRGPLCVPTPVAMAAVQALSTGASLGRIRTEVNPTSMRYLARTGTYSIEKAQRMLGYEPKTDLAAGMDITRQWLREQQLVP